MSKNRLTRKINNWIKFQAIFKVNEIVRDIAYLTNLSNLSPWKQSLDKIGHDLLNRKNIYLIEIVISSFIVSFHVILS